MAFLASSINIKSTKVTWWNSSTLLQVEFKILTADLSFFFVSLTWLYIFIWIYNIWLTKNVNIFISRHSILCVDYYWSTLPKSHIFPTFGFDNSIETCLIQVISSSTFSNNSASIYNKIEWTLFYFLDKFWSQ